MSDFALSQADGRPMYLQIMGGVQQRIAVGDWAPGSKLPSIRELAITLNVSVITVKRAYLELERAGVIVTQHGVGSRVAQDIETDSLARQELKRMVAATAQLAKSNGVDRDQLQTMFDEQMEDL